MNIFLISAFLLLVTTAIGQEDKIKTRVSAQYNKVMNQDSFIAISAKYKGESGFEIASGLEFHVYQKIPEDSLLRLGEVTTGTDGTAKFILSENQDSIASSYGNVSFVIKVENDPKFSDTETELTISVSNLVARLETVDSANQIAATLTDASGQPLPGRSLKVQLQRMFAPLSIGEESYETDENGSIRVPLEEPMPGLNGILTFEIVLSESEEYGTVTSVVSAPIGAPITDQSTFDNRTMWSPPAKTPYYLLIFPNLIIVGVWLPILVLLFNLYRISKVKPNTL